MGFKKTLSDVIIIARIYYLQFRDQLGKYLFSGLLIPLASFFLASATAGREASQQLRFFTGAILLSFSILTIMWLGSILIEDRFYGRLKLFITAPVSPVSYVLGILFYAYILGLVTSLGFFLAARILRIPVEPHLFQLFVVVFLTLSTFASIGVILSQYAGTLQAGGVLADAVSIMLIFSLLSIIPWKLCQKACRSWLLFSRLPMRPRESAKRYWEKMESGKTS